MSIRSPSNTLEHHIPSDGEWPTDPDASTSTPPSTPPQILKPVYTVVNTILALRACLDVLARELTLPPKWYSKAHNSPQTNTPYASTQSHLGPIPNPTWTPPLLFNVPKGTPELYVDAEGISLSRHGELSILILHIQTANFSHTYLIHVHVIGRQTFTTKSTNGLHTLKSILEDNRIAKVLFDCKMDSDALFGQFQVYLGGVIDLQLMCLATRNGGGRYLPGLGKCLQSDLNIPLEEQAWVDAAKDKGQRIWRPRCGGTMERFNDDPLHEDLINYCVVDTAYLPRLFERYNAMLETPVSITNHFARKFDIGLNWAEKILCESWDRMGLALQPNFYGGHAFNPWWIEDDDDDYYYGYW
ncbi:MAG: hypothetical protein LQ337_002461 [Flavoplaca oasis]|nr:MAG: hypothetical protein LQ337_002461 [Flavoplaca oasis]